MSNTRTHLVLYRNIGRMEVCTNGKICVLLSVLLYCYSSTLPGNAWWKSKLWRRETRRRLDSLPASLRPYIVFSMRKTMYDFPALSCLIKGKRERRDKTAGEKRLTYILINWGEGRGDSR